MGKKRKLREKFGGAGEEPPQSLHPSIGAIVESLARDTAERDFRAIYKARHNNDQAPYGETHE